MSTESPRALVFTDLDGSLLGHHDYAIDGALPGLEACAARAIPVIPNTSKTRAEVEPLLKRLSLPWAAIVENGSAIVLPADSPWSDRIAMEHRCLGQPRSVIQQRLQELSALTGARFQAFAEMNLARIEALTGLSAEQARLAAMREYSEPLYWQDSEPALDDFCTAARTLDLQCLRGGRFVHVLGLTDKGVAARRFMDQLGWDATPMIALGDAQNDAAMIQAADVGVWIKAAGRPPPVARARHHTFHTTQSAPTGWTEGIHAALAACHGDMPAPVSQPASHIT